MRFELRPLGVFLLVGLSAPACASPEADGASDGTEAGSTATASSTGWDVDFMDDFDTFDPANWQDQSIWVNDETHCYVPGGEHGTREVSDGTLKIRVVDLGEPRECDSYSKTGVQHPPTQYVAARIISKNRQEFVKGRWTARLRVPDSGQDGMFPAWWLLGARNDEPPIEDEDETVCWPLVGSGEIDVFEHHSDGGLFLLDGEVISRSEGEGANFPEPLFAILNFAKINDAPMTVPSWTMEVDWVKHERRVEPGGG